MLLYHRWIMYYPEMQIFIRMHVSLLFLYMVIVDSHRLIVTYAFNFLFIADMDIPDSVTILNIELLVDSCTSDASLTVSFIASTSVDTTGFIVNCSNNTCVPIVLGPSEEMATLAATDSDHVVNVYTVNRCDQISDPASGRSQREQLSNGNSFISSRKNVKNTRLT